MKRSRFTEDQIIGILKEHEAGVSVADLCRKHGVSEATVYKWKGKAYVAAEKRARRGSLGIWASTFEMPWDWRKAHR